MIKIILIIFVLYSTLNAKEVTIAFGNTKPPFVIGKTKTGLEIDIFREALKYKGYTMKIRNLSNKALEYSLLRIKNIDGVSAIHKKDNDNFYYVDKFVYYDNYAISKKNKNLIINNIDDLRKYKIVVWKHAYKDLGKEFYNIYNPESKIKHNTYKENPNQRNENAMFWINRIDAIIVDKSIFGWYRNQLSKKYDVSEEVVFHPIFTGKTYFEAGFRDKQLANDFQEGLQYIKNTGIYDKLYSKYIKGKE